MPATRKKPASSTVAAVTYCRISNDPTGREAGVDRQRKDVVTIAKHHGWTVVASETDNDRSASRYARRSREGWARVMELVESDQVQALVAYDLDRLLRQPKELERLIDAAEHGLQVATATGELDLATSSGRMMARTLCNMAAAEADRMSERQKAKLRHDASSGRSHWARRPYGYAASVKGSVVPAGLEHGDVVESEAAWIRKAAAWVTDDGLSASEVARRLNAEGVRSALGGLWQAASVKQTLTSPRTAGLREYHGDVAGDAAWQPILERRQWETVCAVLAGRSTGPRGGGRRSLLTKLVRCGRCETTRPMTRTNTGARAEWRCVIRPDIGDGCGLSVSAVRLEAEVIGRLLETVIAEVQPKVRTKQPPADDVDELEQQQLELADMVGRGELTMPEWKAMRAPLEARLTAAKRQAASQRLHADGAALVGLGDPAAAWKGLSDDGRRRVMAAYVERVTVAPAARRGSFDPDRVVVTWKG